MAPEVIPMRAEDGSLIAVRFRSSERPEVELRLAPEVWELLLADIKSGRFELPNG